MLTLHYIPKYRMRQEKESTETERSLPQVAQQVPERARIRLDNSVIYPADQLSPCGWHFLCGFIPRRYRSFHSPAGPALAYTSYYWKLGRCWCF